MLGMFLIASMVGGLLVLGAKKKEAPTGASNGAVDEIAPPPEEVPQLPAPSAPVTPPPTEGPPPYVAETPEEKEAAEEAKEAAVARDWQLAVARAIASNDAPTLDAIAAQMRADGLVEEGLALELLAHEWREELAVAYNEQTGSSSTADDVKAAETPATISKPEEQKAAEALKAYLLTTSRYNENQSRVAEYQRALGVTADGKYGPGTALAMAAWGVIPPAPFYWPANDTQRVLADYKDSLRDKAAIDTPRAHLWEDAARKAGQ